MLITSTNNTYAYRAYLETLLTYGRDATKSHLASSLFHKDESGNMEDSNPLDKDVNDGIEKRHAYFKDAKTVELMGRIHADMFYQQKYLPNDVTIRIRLVATRTNSV